MNVSGETLKEIRDLVPLRIRMVVTVKRGGGCCDGVNFENKIVIILAKPVYSRIAGEPQSRAGRLQGSTGKSGEPISREKGWAGLLEMKAHWRMAAASPWLSLAVSHWLGRCSGQEKIVPVLGSKVGFFLRTAGVVAQEPHPSELPSPFQGGFPPSFSYQPGWGGKVWGGWQYSGIGCTSACWKTIFDRL